jgi:hypothetical protein
LNETAQQIIKDFGIEGIEIKFSGNADNAYKELFSQIEPHILKLLWENTRKLQQLLYRIDIPEKLALQALRGEPGRTPPQMLTELVIKRELQKVVIRKYYKG